MSIEEAVATIRKNEIVRELYFLDAVEGIPWSLDAATQNLFDEYHKCEDIIRTERKKRE